MITSAQALTKFGVPGQKGEGSYMSAWRVPDGLRAAFPGGRGSSLIPAKIYLNNLLREPLEKALWALFLKDVAPQLDSWDGCYIVRAQRNAPGSLSLHCWGLAVDLNAAENPMGAKPKLSPEFVACFTANGFDWGGKWKRPDGMHFQLSTFDQ